MPFDLSRFWRRTPAPAPVEPPKPKGVVLRRNSDEETRFIALFRTLRKAFDDAERGIYHFTAEGTLCSPDVLFTNLDSLKAEIDRVKAEAMGIVGNG